MGRTWWVRFGGLVAVITAAMALRWGVGGVRGAATGAGPDADVRREVVCVFDGEVPAGAVIAEVGGPVVHGTVHDGAVTFVPNHDPGAGTVRVTGFAEVPVKWRAGACEAPVALVRRRVGTVAAAVDVPAPAGQLAVSALCGDERASATVGADGSFAVEVSDGATCQVQLERTFGGLLLAGPWEPLVPGRIYEAPRPGGLGLATAPEADHLRVVAVEPGLPAARAGVQLGDHVLRVDGTPAPDVVVELFDEVDGGVTLDLIRGGTPLTLTLR